MTAPRTLHRSRTDRKIGGVCGGLAAYLGVDPTLVRVAWVLLTVVSFGLGVLAYLAFLLLAPEEPYLPLPPPPPQAALPPP
jgi:phage shock protein C